MADSAQLPKRKRRLTPLADLKNLSNLFIRDTEINDEEVDKLQKALPNCKISR